jgi:hypothetical protein
MREARGSRRRVEWFDYCDGDIEKDDNANDEDDNNDNADGSSNDVPKLFSSGYKLNGWAVHMCKIFVDDISLEWLTYMYYWYPPRNEGKL